MTKLNGWTTECLLVMLCAAMAHAAPTINLSKQIGPPTGEIDVWGHGFQPHSLVDIYFDTKDEAVVLTNNEGEFQHAVIHAPRDAKPGEHWVTALERNNDKSDQKSFVVNTNWSQFHYRHDQDSFNSYENVLRPENVSNLTVRWNYVTGFSVYNSPAISDGVVYAGSDSLYAFNADTGVLFWTYPVPASDTPAVDGGVVYVGSGDGNVYALDARTGALQWKFPVANFDADGLTVADGVVYVGGGGNVYALDAKTGTQRWKYNAGGDLVHSPAVANGIVYVGTLNLLALNAKTGALLWTFESGQVFSSPAVSGGVVYVGSGDGNLYAVDASSGLFLWNYFVDDNYNAVDAPVVSNGVVYQGSFACYVYALNAHTGELVWSHYFGGGDPIYSDPAVANGVVYVGDSAGNANALDVGTGTLLWTYSIGGGVENHANTPSVANGAVYFGTDAGDVYAFSLRGATSRDASLASRPNTKLLKPSPKLRRFDY